MPRYQRSVRVAAPFETVWDFHSTTDGLEAVTPKWMNIRIDSVFGPDGDPDPDILEAGAVVEASVRPFDVGPRQDWRSEITARERSDGTAYFTDVMHDGPFEYWEHTHLFYADGDATLVRDSIEYELPFGILGDIAGPFAKVGFEPMFRFRHRRTRELLE